MTTQKPPVDLLRTPQLLVGSMIGGLMVFLGVVSFLSDEPFEPAGLLEGDPIWRTTTAIFALAIVASVPAMSAVMIRQARTRLRGRPSPGRDDLLRLYFPFVVVRSALLEGLGFFGAVVFLVSGLGLGFLVAIAAIAGLILIFPTADRFRNYCERLSGGPA